MVERGMKGLTTGTLHGKLGIRAGNTGLITMDNVEVPAENRIGEEGEGFLVAMSAIDQGRYTVGAGAVGLAQACMDASVRYAHERETFGEEIGRHQLVKQMIATMAKGTEIGRLLVWRAGWLKNHGVRTTRETSLAKWHATEHSVQAALDAIQIHGANGYSNEFPVERYLRNSKAAVIYEGTSQLHTLIQADYALGYRADRPIRCEPLPAQGFDRWPALGRHD
jgi:glutaryl-CoA dehydrogenase (non-decarboxylating)